MNRAEAQARRLLWLFPLWMRATRGEEAVSLVLDLLPPGARRLPWGSRVDLLRAGLQARRRGTPPLRVWSALAFARRKPARAAIPVGWQPWLASVVNRKSFLVRCALMRSLFLPVMATIWLVFGALSPAIDSSMIPMGLIYLAMWVLSVPAFALRARRWRVLLLAANGLATDGRPLPPDQVQLVWGAPAVANAPLWPALVAGSLVCGGYGTGHWVLGHGTSAPASPLPALIAFAAAVGLAVVVSHRRLRWFDPASPASTAPPRTSWNHQVAPVGVALVAGYAIGWFAAEQVLAGRVHLLAIWAVPAGALVLAAEIRRAQRRIGREVGIWDLVPDAAPQVVVQAPEAVAAWQSRGPGRPVAG